MYDVNIFHIRRRFGKKNDFFYRFLATGDTFYTIGHSFRVGFTTVSAIVTEVCEAICRHMEHIYLPEPTENIWKKCAEEFENRWGFPNCIGSVDGKHVTIKRPNNSGSNYWCYLHKYSIVLMAKI
ncbi:unnamed protein product [Acanthoscelides obtectus]|uniref:DDE Tnp4 domain-containing protein n=1 Tax=Acanthoscelides obtectus TaxID=200917 RepID=A0A9P0L2D2_ACAOB|nr:unnamed protein product [Acanthoscelides obtectus]CAH2001905.1 unnamed protein product [Acanthoscelides obtectus]CAK1669091.1 Protein ANTAGONIST OF LIKE HETEROCHROMATIN PROTEIN 1 [Acanthoscelides obtectus]CAK1670141.1 Protein ANTAGONIST OF LIKE HETEROCHROMATIN PROTEIN 1 [Acanthoscelides obtectus]